MKLHVDCIPCFQKQALKAARIARHDLDRIEAKELLNRVMAILINDQIMDDLPAKTGQRVYGEIGRFFDDPDIFHDLKVQSNNLASEMYPLLKKIVRDSDKPLKTAANIAIIGNLIDLGADHSYDLKEEISRLTLAIDDFDLLQKDLQNSSNLLYLGDNAGEIYFDKVFIEAINERHDLDVTFAVRAGPIINDGTMDDAISAGIDRVASLIESTQSPGLILAEASADFKQLYSSADIIISKGQGNFEALSEQPRSENIYFMLKAKCHVIEQLFGVPVGASILASWRRL